MINIEMGDYMEDTYYPNMEFIDDDDTFVVMVDDSNIENDSSLEVNFDVEIHTKHGTFTDRGLRSMLPENDLHMLIPRHYEIIKDNPRYHRYIKCLFETVMYIDDKVDYHVAKTIPLPTKIDDLFDRGKYKLWVRREDSTIAVVIDMYNQRSIIPIQCTRCNGYEFHLHGSRNESKNPKYQKLRCTCGKYTYIKTYLSRYVNAERDKIASLLLENGCSQNYVAKLLGVSSSTLAKWRRLEES